MSRANETQIGGDHYKVGGEEHWDRVARLKLDYFQAQITKYIERWKKKNGVQDLEKAQHFLAKYIELAKENKIDGQPEMPQKTQPPATKGPTIPSVPVQREVQH